MDRCRDEDLGHFITFYETGALTEAERIRFENHLLECDFCRRELQEMQPAYAALNEHRQEILAQLSAEGLNFSKRKQQLLDAQTLGGAEKTSPAIWWDRLLQAAAGISRPRVAIPALAVGAALILFLLWSPSREPANPYLLYLNFEKAFFQAGEVRSESAAPDAFRQGMELYQQDDFLGAIGHLEKAAQSHPDEGTTWLYLGISYYLERQPKPAIEALRRAEQLTEPAQRNRALWYLAQAYLMEGSPDLSLPLLRTLASQKLEYATEADTLLVRIASIEQRK